MLRRANKVSIVAVTSVLVATMCLLGTASAQKSSVPKPQNRLALAEDQIKHLLSFMEADKNGKVSKEQYMNFMEAEFKRLDKDNKGELDVRELTKSTLTASRFVGK
jgi:hypothetical protein